VKFSEPTGLRLCGIDEEPFWPVEKYPPPPATSVRCRCRTSIASRSSDEAMTASVGEVHGVPGRAG